MGPAESGPGSVKEKPTLLNVALEIRYSIYAYFLEFEKDVDMPDGKSKHHQIDSKLFQICRQLRSETLQYLLGRCCWIPLTVPRRADLDDQVLALTHLPLGFFSRRERDDAIAGSTLHIEVGEPPLFQDETRAMRCSDRIAAFCCRLSTSCQRWGLGRHFAADGSYGVLICHSVASQCRIYHFLASLQASGRPLTITLTSSFYQTPSTIGAFVLPLTRLRNQKSGFEHKVNGQSDPKLARTLSHAMNRRNHDISDWEEHLVALKEEGDRMFRRAYYRLALDYYEDGLRVSGQFSMHLKNLDSNKQPPEAEVYTVRTLRTDMIIVFLRTWNIFVDSHRDATGHASIDVFESIKVPFDILNNLFYWTGISGQQRATAYYQRAIAFRNLAEYASLYEYGKGHCTRFGTYFPASWDVTPFLMEAANGFLQVWQADITDESAEAVKGLHDDTCERYEATWTHWGHELPRTLNRITEWRAGTWIEASKTANAWTEMELRSSDPLSVDIGSQVGKRERLERLRRDLGFPHEQEVDGLFRLLAAGTRDV